MPDTFNYMLAGYIVGLAILAITVGSVWWRFRNLAADEKTLETMEAEIGSSAPAPSSETVKA